MPDDPAPRDEPACPAPSDRGDVARYLLVQVKRTRWWSGHGAVRVAATRRARLLGLAGLSEPPPCALLLPGTRSVHTFGMRFALDLIWLDRAGAVLRVDRRVSPGRVRSCRRAAGVCELASDARY